MHRHKLTQTMDKVWKPRDNPFAFLFKQVNVKIGSDVDETYKTCRSCGSLFQEHEHLKLSDELDVCGRCIQTNETNKSKGTYLTTAFSNKKLIQALGIEPRSQGTRHTTLPTKLCLEFQE